MFNFIFVNFFDNFLFYNFILKYQQQHPEYFIVNFNIIYIEGNFPHSFFTQYNYLQNTKYLFIEANEIQQLLYLNKIPLCLDLNNKYLIANDLNDKYLLMLLLNLHHKTHYIHCNQHYLCELLYKTNLDYIYIDDNFFYNIGNIAMNDEEKIYNFSNIQTKFNQINYINFDLLDQKKNYRILINNIKQLIKLFILPNYQLDCYEEYLKYEKEICPSWFMGAS